MRVPSKLSWPQPLSEKALHGLAGDVVRTIGPLTESDPVALLVQFLVAVGNLFHREPHWQVEAVRHPLNLYAVLVGDTSKARKGTSWAHVRRLASSTDEIVWGRFCIQTGLSSGEGLIHAVRDPEDDDSDDGDGDGDDAPRKRRADLGPIDTRLLVVESEFASPFRMMARDGNTLSPVIRQAWDGEPLQVLTKQSPEIATKAHVSIIGHITHEELLREMTRIDMANGFGNRILWLCVRRSKQLPDGGQVPPAVFEDLTTRLKKVVTYVQSLGDCELTRDQEAKSLWNAIYGDLSEGKRGLFGAITSRAEAQVMRIACVYALLDESSVVGKCHLEAALAVWKYCEDSARYIFGDALGHPLADELLRILRAAPEGLTRTAISDHFGRNRKSQDIAEALTFLSERGLAKSETKETEGRPVERWFAVKGPS